MRIGVLGGADIAFRRFVPAVLETEGAECVGIASNQEERRKKFFDVYHIPVFDNYDELINNSAIDAIYIPLPPALHYKWAYKALKAGKHVYLEKPATTRYSDTVNLVRMAEESNLILQENYMFCYHSQLQTIQHIIATGKIGLPRLYKAAFGFPLRSETDFRYNSAMGGGALLDAGGYIIKLASYLLGDSIEVCAAESAIGPDYEVDMFGTMSFRNDKGTVFQGAYGMDCYYQCCLEVWGNKGRLYTNRIFTAPPEYSPLLKIETTEGSEEIILQPDDHFKEALKVFMAAESDSALKKSLRDKIILQSRLVEDVRSFWR